MNKYIIPVLFFVFFTFLGVFCDSILSHSVIRTFSCYHTILNMLRLNKGTQTQDIQARQVTNEKRAFKGNKSRESKNRRKQKADGKTPETQEQKQKENKV